MTLWTSIRRGLSSAGRSIEGEHGSQYRPPFVENYVDETDGAKISYSKDDQSEKIPAPTAASTRRLEMLPSEERIKALDEFTQTAKQQNVQADALIAVMGLTGTGKSSFISLLTESEVEIGDDLESCTSKVSIHSFENRGLNIALIDTPGFDDTYRSDSEVLQDVACFLAQVYSEQKKIAGILYLHKITDNRMTGSVSKNLMMFQALCGTGNLPNVVLATTMWDTLKNEKSQQLAIKREEQLKSIYWKDMVDSGSQIFRHDNSTASAVQIIDHIMKQQSNIVLPIQVQLVDEKKTLAQTDAGRALRKEILAQEEKHLAEIGKIKKAYQDAIDAGQQQTAARLERTKKEYEEKMRNLEQGTQDLQKDFDKLKENNRKQYEGEIKKLNEELDKMKQQHQERQAQLVSFNEEKYAKDKEFKLKMKEMELESEKLKHQTEQEKRDHSLKMKGLDGQLAFYQAEAARMEEKLKQQSIRSSLLQTLAGGGIMLAGIALSSPSVVAAGGGIAGNGVTKGVGNKFV